MYLKDANFCISGASSHEEPDMYLCSLVEKIAWKMVTKQNFDFDEEGARGLRLYGRVYGSKKHKDGSLIITKPLDSMSFGEDGTAYAVVFPNAARIESFSPALQESLKLLAASAVAKEMVGRT